MIASYQYTLTYDHTFEGLLSAVFQVYERKLAQTRIISERDYTSDMFSSKIEVSTKTEHSKRVWDGLKARLPSQDLHKLYVTFLTEKPNREALILGYIQHVFSSKENISGDFANPYVLGVSQAAKMIGRESHRMEAFVRFKLTRDGIYFANIEPDFDVLPIITKHFKSRYADQRWMIYDLKRKYGIYYNLEKVETIQLTLPSDYNANQTSDLIFDESEKDFQQLWHDYFKHTNIASRKNMRLHIRHVPKRYWKYLSEKQPEIRR